MTIFCSENLFWFQSYWDSDNIHGNFGIHLGNYMVVIYMYTFFTKYILLCHICWWIYSTTVTYDWIPIFFASWRVPHVGQEMPIISGTLAFNPFGEFMISPIHYIYYIICQYWDNVYGSLRINDSVLFAWTSFTAMSRTYLLISTST